MIKHNTIKILTLVVLAMVGCKKEDTYHDEFKIQTQTNGPITLSLIELGYGKVTFRAQINVDLMADYQEVGFIHSTDDNLKINNSNAQVISIKEDIYEETFKVSWDTMYYYTTYTLRNDIYSYGETQCFTTLSNPYDIQSELNISAAVNLSSSASANCYIVSEAGLYKFETVKGNSSESVGSVASASILWESFGTSETPEFLELINGVCYSENYIVFRTANTFKEGNAVIAAKDADGNILWSWHIWLTDEPQGQVYNNNAGTMMDRNLGATSATPGDVGALGLLYQWGRKDPFLNSSSISSNTLAKSTIAWPLAVSTSSSVATVDYVTSHPTTFVTASLSTDEDWHYYSRDNPLWTTSESEKSIYDPCPAGWRVPDGDSRGVWSKAIGSSSNYTGTYDSTNEGINFSGKFASASTIWYPASGCRSDSDGSLGNVGHVGFYWSASPYGDYACSLYFISSIVHQSNNNYPRACGGSVRCIQE